VNHILSLVHVRKETDGDTKVNTALQLDIIDSYSSLLKRVFTNDTETEIKVIQLIQNKIPPEVIKGVFDRFYRLEVCSGPSFISWRDDTNLNKDKQQQKIKKATLLKVNSWLADIETELNKVNEPEEETEIKPEEEEEEEDEYHKNPNIEFFTKTH